MIPMNHKYTSIEICAGAGGQAIGLERAGFEHLAAVEIDSAACATLKLNRPNWNVVEDDLRNFKAFKYEGIDLFAGGVPCPPFSIAGKQLGENDERDLFPEVIRIAGECKPKAIMIENVKGLLSSKFDHYRKHILSELEGLGYQGEWRLLNACDFGVPQLRPRAILVVLRGEYWSYFNWPVGSNKITTVADALKDMLGQCGWLGVDDWQKKANVIAPTIVGGSKKHGGPDLGPTRAKKVWSEIGINGKGIADFPPDINFSGMPKLTVGMAARIQGFPIDWKFSGRKTSSYRQVGNAFPPPVAEAVGKAIIQAINELDTKKALVYEKGTRFKGKASKVLA